MVVSACVAVAALCLAPWPFIGHSLGLVVYPAHILLHSDPSGLGSRVYVDGRHVLTVNEQNEVLHLRIGTYTVEAKKQGYLEASLSYRVVDDEQGSRDRLVLGSNTKQNRLTLIVD